MGEVVAGFGVPHSPHLPEQARKDPAHPLLPVYAKVAAAIEAAKPDVLVIFDCDHFATLFLDNLPIFTVGTGTRTAGPNDMTLMPRYDNVPVHGAFADHMRRVGIDAGFDLGLLQDFEIDHSVIVPLHFMTPTMNVPIVPVFINCFVPPLPSARRCYALGQAMRAAAESFPGGLRVAALASGSFSLEIGGPKVAPGMRQGIPDKAWIHHVTARLKAGEIDELIAESTTERLLKAGNVAGELLCWIAMLGMVGGGAADWTHQEPDEVESFAIGEVFGIWNRAAA